MRLLFIILTITSFTLLSTPSSAIDFAVDDVLVDCVSTPSIESGNYPGVQNIQRTNNLRRKTGIALVAKGEPIYVWGRVVDEDCLPIDNAEVEIWQTNTYGKYQNPYQTGENLDENFAGTGFATTDNLGRFNFLSIFPGKTEDSAPRIHFRVRHPSFPVVETVMYFPESEANANDDTLKRYQDQSDALIASYRLEAVDGKYKVELPDQDMVYQFNITMPGKNKFKQY